LQRADLKRLPFAVSLFPKGISFGASSRKYRADTGLRQALAERVCRYFQWVVPT
jgi:hypothetical protein